MNSPRQAAACFFLSGLWLFVCFAVPAGATECRDETEVFTGTLRLVRTRHAMNGTPIEAWQIALEPAVCVLYKESIKQKDKSRLGGIGAIHLLVTPSEARRLKGRSGLRISVKAGLDGGVSPPLTAWHIGDAIMVHPEIVSIGGKPFR